MESFYHAMKAHCTYDLTAFSTFKNKMIHTPYRNYNNISIQKIWKQTVFSVFDSNTALRETQTSDQKFFNLNPRNNSALISSIFWSFRKKKSEFIQTSQMSGCISISGTDHQFNLNSKFIRFELILGGVANVHVLNLGVAPIFVCDFLGSQNIQVYTHIISPFEIRMFPIKTFFQFPI